MTPVLAGRLQIRSLLIIIVAIPYTFLLSLLLSVPAWALWIALLLAILFGYFMDVVCNFLQQKRWDGDWPPLLFLIAGIIEFVLLFESMKLLLPEGLFRGEIIALHYWVMWLISYLFIQHMFHPFRPLYKYSGGRVLPGTDISARLR